MVQKVSWAIVFFFHNFFLSFRQISKDLSFAQKYGVRDDEYFFLCMLNIKVKK